MIHRLACFRLPLVHHLMQKGILDRRPRIMRDMTAIHGDLGRVSAGTFERQVAKPATHSPAQADGQVGECRTEAVGIEPRVGKTKAFDPGLVRLGDSPRLPPARRARCELLHGKGEKDLARRQPVTPAG